MIRAAQSRQIETSQSERRQGQAPRSCEPFVCLREMNIV